MILLELFIIRSAHYPILVIYYFHTFKSNEHKIHKQFLIDP